MKEFNITNLNELDGGKAAIAFALQVKRASLDCQDRPGDKSARVVTLKVALVPRVEQDGDCTEVQAQLSVEIKLPRHQTKLLSLGLRRNGSLVFNPDSPDEVDQSTLFPEEEGGDA